jgi:hypothetical protein
LKILPPQTQPPQAPTARRHHPAPASRWTAYRSCLRWDFGFTCPFCLLHEADLLGGLPGEGLGVTTVEHWIPRAEDASRQNDYGNCLYACRFCNRARSVQPVSTPGADLLDPTARTWSDHFRSDEDRLLPVDGDLHAAYTHRAYDLDDPRKVIRRQVRRHLVSDRLLLLERLGTELAALRERAGGSPDRLNGIEEAIQQILSDARRAYEDLERYQAIPIDAPANCRCASHDHHRLPEEIGDQLVDVFTPI